MHSISISLLTPEYHGGTIWVPGIAFNNDTTGGIMQSSDPQIINVAGVPVKVVLKSIPVKPLQLDPANPRIRSMSEIKGITPKGNVAVQNLLLEDEDIRQLLADIKRAGGIHDPVLINKDGTIIEGNSRVACYMKLLEKDAKSGRWDNIPALVLLEQMKPDNVAILQAYYHVRMKNKWITYAKAAHIYELHNTHEKTFDQIRLALGMQEKTIKCMMRAYETMKKHCFDKDTKKDPEKVLHQFSYFLELEKRPELEGYRKTERDRKRFVKAVKDGKFERGEDVRKLAPIMKNPKTRAAFEKGGIKAAKPLLCKVAPSVEYRQYSLIGRITKYFNVRFTKEVQLVRDNNTCAKMLKQLVDTMNKVLAAAKGR